MYAEERQKAMADLVVRRGRMSVLDLAEEYQVTTETVRRDLSLLERAGVLRRVHGGAVPASALMETVLADRDEENSEVKERIAKAALEQGHRISSMIIDAGSSTARLAGMLPRDRSISVYTHAVPVAFRIGAIPNIELHMLPGRVRPVTQAAVGAQTVAALAQVRVDIAFNGTNGLSLTHGLSTPDSDEAEVKRALIQSARRTVLLADASKFDREFTVRFAELSDVDVIVTDPSAPPRMIAELERHGIEVIVA